jgi:hypothetical protein
MWSVPIEIQSVGVENEIDFSVASEFELNQNYPNPFNPATVIEFKLSVSSVVSLKIYDVIGKEIVSLLNDFREAGNHKVNFEASKFGLSSGIYFYTLTANGFIQTKSMLLLK